MYPLEYYSAMRKKGILLFGITWMDLGGITISEIEKDKHSMVSLIHRVLEKKKVNSLKQSRKVVVWCWGVGTTGRSW